MANQLGFLGGALTTGEEIGGHLDRGQRVFQVVTDDGDHLLGKQRPALCLDIGLVEFGLGLLECGLGGGASDTISNDLHIRGAYTGPGWDFTVQLYSSSPAFDAGNPQAPSDTILARCATTDFLNRPRPVDASGSGATPRCDIGALEAQSEPSLFIDDFEGRWLRP